MATDLETRSAPRQSEASLQRKFADLSARVKRVDFLTHVLVLALTVAGYALVIGWFDWFAGNSQAAVVEVLRWTGFGVFIVSAALLLILTARCSLRRVNPYFVADQLERTCPDAKNSLINWLDLHDQGLPSVFQKHLSTRAAESFDSLDSEQALPRRRNRMLLSALALPTLGLLILLLLGPAAFLGSMLRAFAPFYAPPPQGAPPFNFWNRAATPTSAPQAIAFAAKIEGHIPASHRPDAPRLLYRYQVNEDYFALPLQAEGAGTWTAELPSEQLRTGFSYKIAAGDAETPEHQVRVRGRAHVKQFEITYRFRPYLKHANKSVAFPNKVQATPVIHGLRGTEVEMIVRMSRPVKKAAVTVDSADSKIDVPTRLLSDDPHAFTCRFTLTQSGHFRVRFTAADGEENVDRGDYPIEVRADEAPTVVLTKPAADVALAENGTLRVEGRASDDFGVSSLALHVRVLSGPRELKLAPKVYRAGKPLQFADGTDPDAIEYEDFLALDQLKDDKGTTHFLPPGTVLEYWLEATDNADYPNPTGNVGKSAAYKITLLPKSPDAAAQRDKVIKDQKRHEQRQDNHFAQPGPKSNSGGAGSQGGSSDPKEQKKQNDAIKQQLDKAAGPKDQKPSPGESKGSNQPNADKKDGPDSKDGPQPKDKSQKSKSPDNAGNNKDKGDGQGGAGQSKAGGDDAKKQESASKGESKDGPKEVQGGEGRRITLEARADGRNQERRPDGQRRHPRQTSRRITRLAIRCRRQKANRRTFRPRRHRATARAPSQSGPEPSSKDAATAQGPMPAAKGSKPSEPGANDAEPKQPPPEQAKDAGQPRDQGADPGKQDAEWDRLAKLVAEVAKHDKNGDGPGKELADLAKNSDDPRKPRSCQGHP